MQDVWLRLALPLSRNITGGQRYSLSLGQEIQTRNKKVKGNKKDDGKIHMILVDGDPGVVHRFFTFLFGLRIVYCAHTGQEY